MEGAVKNGLGAWLFVSDPDRNPSLPIPRGKKGTGAVYTVLTLGRVLGDDGGAVPVVTVKASDGSPVAYKLPMGYMRWVDAVLGLCLSGEGKDLFPRDFEFWQGEDGQDYADTVG